MDRDSQATPDLLRIIRRRWPTIVAAVLLAALTAFGLSQLQQKSYDATASLVFGDRSAALDLLGQGSSSSGNDAERVAATMVELVSARDVVNRTAREVNRAPDKVDQAVHVEGKGVSNVVSVTASDSSPRFAAELANSYAAGYIELRRESDAADLRAAQDALQRKLDGLTTQQRTGGVGRLLRQRQNELEVSGPLNAGSVRIAQRAFPPEDPSSPNVKLNTLLGALIGLLLGLGIATLRDRVDRRLMEPEDQSEAYGMPILAALPGTRSLDGQTERFRSLHARLEHFHFGRDIRVVLVTSASDEEGTSNVAWHLAAAAALRGDRRVLLIEGNLRTPSVGAVRGLDPSPGLLQVVSGGLSLENAVQQAAPGNGDIRESDTQPDVLTAGVPAGGNGDGGVPYDLFDANAMVELLREADRLYDYVVIDSAPLGEVADAIPLVHHVDGVLVVSRRRKTTRAGAESLRELLRALGAPVLGVVAIGAKPGTEFGVGAQGATRRGPSGRLPSRAGG
jgi:Mrp family chromosome partitioning ATPase